jgi:hypothetical protein
MWPQVEMNVIDMATSATTPFILQEVGEKQKTGRMNHVHSACHPVIVFYL